MLNGSRPASLAQMLRWAIVIDRVCVFPLASDVLELFPPGVLPDDGNDIEPLSNEAKVIIIINEAMKAKAEQIRLDQEDTRAGLARPDSLSPSIGPDEFGLLVLAGPRRCADQRSSSTVAEETGESSA